jgi:hypothetical protein
MRKSLLQALAHNMYTVHGNTLQISTKQFLIKFKDSNTKLPIYLLFSILTYIHNKLVTVIHMAFSPLHE